MRLVLILKNHSIIRIIMLFLSCPYRRFFSVADAFAFSPSHSRRHAASTRLFSSKITDANSHLISLEQALELVSSVDKKTSSSTTTTTAITPPRFIDASWYHKGDRNGRKEFEAGPRIPNSAYFDLTDICDKESNVWAMLPPKSLVDAWLHHYDMIIPTETENDQPQYQPQQQHLIVYGKEGARFTPRVWFTLQQALSQTTTMKVSLLQAPLEDWIQAGGPIETHPVTVITADELQSAAAARSKHDHDHDAPQMDVIDLEAMKEAVLKPDDKTIILDARGSSFAVKGYMPGALHVPYSSLTDKGSTIHWKSDLRDVFVKAGVDPLDESKRIICTCGSGVSACSLYLALRECGRTGETLVYDGSWSEWKQYDDLPKVLPK